MIELSIVLGTYALTLALVESEGPWGIFDIIRHNRYIDNFGVLNCMICSSFWVSVALCVACQRIDLVLIAWGANVLIDRIVTAIMLK